MAALRSGMAMLGRRCSGSSSAACMGGKVFRPAPPPLHPAAVRKLEVIFAYLYRSGLIDYIKNAN